jgi:hypothetical protein
MTRFQSTLAVITLIVPWMSGVVGLGQTAGEARLEVTILDYNGSSTKHWTVAWVTTGSGTFIKTLRKQGPSITASHWNSHCGVWYAAKAGSTALDGYSSATAQTYSGTNSPVILTWDGLDANSGLMPDGEYKFWVQYAEDNGQGPYTTSGLLWRKQPDSDTRSYPNQAANFSNMRVTWTPSVVGFPPVITSAPPTGAAMVGLPYHFSCVATGTPPIGFTAQGPLPPGLSLSSEGTVSGVPTSAGTFAGSVVASNGYAPDAVQPFRIVVDAPSIAIDSVRLDGSQFVLSGTGPAGLSYRVLTASNVDWPVVQWTSIATNTIDSSGKYAVTNALDAGTTRGFYLLRVP